MTSLPDTPSPRLPHIRGAGENTGNTNELMYEPKRYAWKRDGILVAGTLHDYARMMENDYYTGDQGLTDELVYWDGTRPPETRKVLIRRHSPTENDYIPYEIRCGDEQVTIYIDGRA